MDGVMTQAALSAPAKKGLLSQMERWGISLLEVPSEAVSVTFFSNKKAFGLATLTGLIAVAPSKALAIAMAVHIANFTAQKTGALLSGLSKQAVMVNALFLALAMTVCVANPWEAMILAMVASPLTVLSAQICKRALLPWNLSVYVAPYLLVVWAIWHGASYTPLLSFSIPTQNWESTELLVDWAKAVALGFSQIFFLIDVRFGVFIGAVLLLTFRTTGLTMILACAYSVSVGFLLKADPWISHSGILAFPAILAVAAFEAGPREKSQRLPLLTMVALAPFFELAALRIGYFSGLPSFSLSYLLLMWAWQLFKNGQVKLSNPVWSQINDLK